MKLVLVALVLCVVASAAGRAVQMTSEISIQRTGGNQSPAVATPYTETFYLRASGDGSAPEEPDGAWDVADLDNAANWDTDISNDGKFGPNDRVIVLDDDGAFRSTLTVQQSGLAGSPITIQGEAGGTPTVLGSDLVSTWTVAAGAPANTWQATLTTEPNIVLFDSTIGTNVASLDAVDDDGEWFWDSNILYQNSSSDPDTRFTSPGTEAGQRLCGVTTNAKDYLTIEDLTASHTQHWGGGVCLTDSSYVTVRNNTLTKNYYAGVRARDTHGDNTVDGCTISYNGWVGITSWYTDPHADTGSNKYLRNLIFENGWVDWQASSGIIAASSNTEVAFNTLYNNGETNQDAANFGHNHGIYVGVSANTGWDVHDNTSYSHGYGSGIKVLGSGNVYNNVSYDNYQAGLTVGFNAVSTTTLNVYYNVFYGSHFGLWEYGHVSGSYNLVVYNNTFAQNYDATLDIYPYELYIDDDLASLIVKNNIFSGSAATHHQVGMVTQTGATIDYNLHHYDSNSIWYNAANRSYSYWQSILSFDANGVQADPVFVAPGSNNFHLQSGSPARDSGTDVSLTLDYDGMVVPQETNPAIGAYEYIP